MSIPRDLQGRHPGLRRPQKINAAYELGGPRLTVDGQGAASTRPSAPFKINHVVNVDFGGFRRAINYIGGVYVDIDRRYYNDNTQGGENYATIDVDPGYQKLKGRDALDYVRYRHSDNDLVRAARQQDFLRQIRNAAGARRAARARPPQPRSWRRLFARYIDTTRACAQKKQIFSLAQARAVHRPEAGPRGAASGSTDATTGVYLTASQDKLEQDRRRVPAARRRRPRPRQAARARRGPQVGAGAQGQAQQALRRPGPRGRAPRGRGPGDRRRPASRLPVLLPDAALPRLALRRHRSRGSTRSGTSAASKHRAYRLVLSTGVDREYYGIQGMTWRDPPILDDPHRDPQGQRAQARAALRRQPAADRRVADEARRLLGLEHADPVAWASAR